MKFTLGQLAHSGDPTPAVTLTATTVNHTSTKSLDVPTGVAFDGGGNLWVGNQDSDHSSSVDKFEEIDRFKRQPSAVGFYQIELDGNKPR